MQRLMRRWQRAFVLGFLFLIAGCAGPLDRWQGENEPATATVGPSLSVAALLAPVTGDGRDELAYLATLVDSPAVQLRRAFIELETDNTEGAGQILTRILHGSTQPSVAVEAYAFYLRALLHEKRGEFAAAERDRQRAAGMAIDDDLRDRIRNPGPRPPRGTREGGEGGPGVLAQVTVLPRSAWRATAGNAREMVPMEPLRRITIHHSAVLCRDNSLPASAAAIQLIQKQHMQENQWGDIGYHFLVDRAGRLWTGRPLQWQGAHAGNTVLNRGNVGICLLGNFVRNREGQEPTAAQVRTLRILVAALARTHRIGPDEIHTHRELKPTECPGENLQVVVDQIRRERAGLAKSH